jgi:hypothetical protein
LIKGIRLTGLFDSAAGSNAAVLREHTGFGLVRDGADWVIPEDDPVLLAGPRNILIAPQRPFELKAKDYGEIAQQYSSNYRAVDLEHHLGALPPEIVIPGGYGLSSELEEVRNRFYFSKNEDIEKALIQHVFPLMRERLGARFVLPVRIDVTYQQALLSLPKITLLLKLFGTDDATKRIFELDALKSILPTPVEIQGYLDAMLFISPFAFALPVSRPGSTLYFLGESAWQFPRIATENLFEQFASDIEPATTPTISGLFSSPGVGEHGIRSMLMCSIDAINGLMRFLNDPRNFLGSNAEFDQQKNIQAQCAVRLMFADLLAMNFSTSFHVRHRLAFLFLDKLANLIALFSASTPNEPDLFKTLLSLATGTEVSGVIARGMRKRHARLSEAFRKSVLRTYRTIHGHVTLKTNDPGIKEADRLAHLRTLRNLGHGTNLHAQKFEQTFFGGAPTIPSELTYVPLFMALALGFDTKTILDSSKVT